MCVRRVGRRHGEAVEGVYLKLNAAIVLFLREPISRNRILGVRNHRAVYHLSLYRIMSAHGFSYDVLNGGDDKRWSQHESLGRMSSTKTMRPFWHAEHTPSVIVVSRHGSTSFSVFSTVTPSPGMAASLLSLLSLSNFRHNDSFCSRTLLARNPYWRIRWNPLGRLWRRNRRMNSSASRVIVRLRFPWA